MSAEPVTAPIYYYVDHTSRFEHNSGIQRCVRALARALLELGQPLVPVVWDRQRQCLAPASAQALAHLARWSGPAAQAWSPICICRSPHAARAEDGRARSNA